MTRVTIFSEYSTFQKTFPAAIETYPHGLYTALYEILKKGGFEITVVTMSDTDDGTALTDEILNATDVLVWWGHMLHNNVSDEVCEKVANRVLGGMGCIFLHSSHFAKPFKKLMGTTCTLKWRENNERERLWCVNPTHPIAQGVPEQIELTHEEMYGEFFDIPKPDEIVFIGWYQGGEVFRSGVTFTRGAGKIFYFQPGHETNGSFYNEHVQKILINAVNWAKPYKRGSAFECKHVEVPLEKF